MDGEELIKQWRTAIRISHRAHADAAARCEKVNRLLGVPAIVLATLIGTSIIATMEAAPSTTTQAFAGLGVLAIAVLTALQTFLAYSDRAQRHREAVVRYGDLRRELEELTVLPDAGAKLRKRMEDIRTRWREVEAMSPVVAKRLHDRARDLVLGTRDK